MWWDKRKVLFTVVGILWSLFLGSSKASSLVDGDFWEMVFQRHGSIMLLIDTESGQIVNANEAAAAFYGYSVEELQSMSIQRIHLYSPDDVARERRAAANEERNYFVFPHRLANGEIRTVEVHSYPVDEEQALLFSVITDITAREAAEQELLETNARLRRAEMITGLGSWEFRLSDDKLFLSEGAEKILGLVSGAPLPDLYQITLPQYNTLREQALQDLIEKNIPYDLEMKLERVEDGAIIDIRSMGEYDPTTNSVFGVLLDITEQKAAERALALSNKRRLYSLWGFALAQLLIIIVLIINILQRRKAQQETRQNLQRNESLVRILQHSTDSAEELLDYALTESITLTASALGYIYLYNEEANQFTLNTWSHNTQLAGTVTDTDAADQLTHIAPWEDAVRQRQTVTVNDFVARNSLKRNLTRFMTLPIFDQGKIVAVIGLANKQTNYDDMDIWQVTLLMNGLWASLERKRSETALKEEKERLRTTLLSVGDGVIATDRHGRVEIINEVAQHLTGWSGTEALGQPFGQVFKIIDEQTREKRENPLLEVLSSGTPKSLSNHTLLASKSGGERAIAYSAAPIRNSEGEVTGAVLVFRDVTEEQMRVERIEYLSYHDQLTGLYNRRFFEEKLQNFDTDEYLPLSIVMADLNALKLVNDTFGHAVGDRLLRRTAQVMKRVCGEKDIIARWGGDEFVLLLPKTTEQEAEEKAKRIQEALQTETVESMPISMALGWHTKTDSSEDVSAVFKKAENHMYRAKLFQGSGIRSETIQALMVALYETNQREEEHSKRVSLLSQHLGRALGLSDEESKELAITGLFHDIGKIAIDEAILNKPSRLTEDEWKEIMRHPEVGYRLLGAVQDMEDIASYVLAHHERWDGLGYPKGIQGKEIPLQSRIVAIADAYDAMVSERPYRKSLAKQQAIEELEKNAGKQFDPEILDTCIRAITIWDEATAGFEPRQGGDDSAASECRAIQPQIRDF